MAYPKDMRTPAFVLDEKRLIKNLELIAKVKEDAGIDIILAFKGFAMWSVFPLVSKYASGATASSLHEARLCFEEFGKPAHTYSPTYLEDEVDEIAKLSSHITFNSLSQYNRFYHKMKAANPNISFGLRVNPEYSDVETELYNPANPHSRLGVLKDGLNALPEGIEGLHFHVLCESDSHALQKVIDSFEEKFGNLLKGLKWVNMGGGHLMTRKDYDIPYLVKILKAFKKRHNVNVILEPGSAFAWDAGDLVTTVVDIVERRGVKTLLIDASFTAHMPDVLEMPYRPRIFGEVDKQKSQYHYRIGGTSCLAGDFVDEYHFDHEINIGDRLIFHDMIHYTMVKTTTFNGVRHPDISILDQNGNYKVIRRFTYEDFKNRLS